MDQPGTRIHAGRTLAATRAEVLLTCRLYLILAATIRSRLPTTVACRGAVIFLLGVLSFYPRWFCLLTGGVEHQDRVEILPLPPNSRRRSFVVVAVWEYICLCR